MKETIKKLTLIWIALILGQITFLAVILFLRKSGQVFGDIELGKILTMYVPFVVVFFVGASILFFKRQMSNIKTEENIESKMDKYIKASIISFALLEMPSILSLISLLLSGNKLFLYISIMIIFLFLISKPSENKINMDLGIPRKE